MRTTRSMRFTLLGLASTVAALVLGTGCASTHHVQFAEIDSTRGKLEPFEIQVSDTGVSVQDGAALAKAAAPNAGMKQGAGSIGLILALTQIGPKTGEPTFSDDWADRMVPKILDRCPSGEVTGLVARRETMKYPVISGEIVTIKGYCIQ